MSVNQLKEKISTLNIEMKKRAVEYRDELNAKDKEITGLKRALEAACARYNREVFGFDEQGKALPDERFNQGLANQLARANQRIGELERPNGTPANNYPEGEDPFVNYLDKERSDLILGDLTDDQLANAVYMHGNETPSFESLVAGTAKMPLVYLTAAKERIRWLSRKLLEVAQSKSIET